MRILSALCDRATLRDNLLHVLGAGISKVGLSSVPGPLDVDLALLIRAEEFGDLAGSHQVTVRVVGDDGQAVAEVGYVWEVEINAGEEEGSPPPTLPIAVPLHNVAVMKFGRYDVKVELDGVPVDSLPLMIHEVAALMPASREP